MTGASAPLDPSLRGVIWAETCKEDRVGHPSLQHDCEVDLTVIGAGFCGLSTALGAAGEGLSVAVLEAGRVGNGASGRNGGFVVPQFPGTVTPSDAQAWLGVRKGRALAHLVSDGPSLVAARIRAHSIACDAECHGWLQPAHSRASLRRVRAVYEQWRALGYDVEWLDGEAVAALTGASGYLGGWRRANGMSVNPYALCLGLARAAQAAGARIFEGTRATRISPGGERVVVDAGAARVSTRKVVVATNGYTADLLPGLARSAVPVQLFHTATEPLPESLRKSILPTRSCFTDTRRSGGFARYDCDGRLLSGGLVTEWGRRREAGEAHARRRMAELFPQLGPVDVRSWWTGYCAVTENFLPRLQVLAPRVFAIGGYSTRGVALSQNLGALLGEFCAERLGLDELPIAVTEGAHRMPLQRLKALAARYVFPCYRALDRLGLS